MNGSFYVVGQSWLHRLPAGRKLAVLALAGAGLMWVHSWQLLGLALSVVLGLIALSGVTFRQLLAQIRLLLWFMLALGAYSALVESPAIALEMLLRLSTLVLAAQLVSMTTPITQMMAVVEYVLQPLDRLGWLSAQRVSLACGLTLRLIPELALQWQDIREAQAARGLKPGVLTMLVPMLLRTLRRAEEIAEAIDARASG
jgi:biotin transport system permease protein